MSPKEGIISVKGLVAGGLTGSLEILVSYPIKYVKTQMQLERKFGAERQYTGILDCAKKTVKSHGFRGLYRGFNVFFYGPKSALRFGSFETLKGLMKDERGNLSPLNRLLCGLCAGAIEASIVNAPLETVETKVINDQRTGEKRFRGFVHGARLIYKEEGLKGIYQGVGPSVAKQASNQGMRFFVVESLKTWQQKGDSKSPVPKGYVLIFGGIAGFISCVGNNPIDVVKTRMQGLEAHRYSGTFNCFSTIWKEEGFLSFYRGISPRLTRVVLEVAVTFLIYEYIQDAFRAFQQEKPDTKS